ncbi:MAG: zinc-dependent alcohol dehydrogenase [Acidimicrobiales bacterium]
MSPSVSSSPVPDTMAAAVYQSPGVVTVEKRAVPPPGPGELLVAVDHCGICGSDIHQLRDGWGLKAGAVAGHEWSGTIVGVGADVDTWSIGERVVGGPSPRCGTCRRCREGKPSQCENRQLNISDWPDGAFAEYILVSSAGVLRLPDGLSARQAALAEPLSVALHGITRSGIGPGDTAMVIGAGPIGALSVVGLQSMGVTEITVVEPNEGRKRLALDLGVTRVLDPADLELIPPWEPERLSAHAVHVVLECSGHKSAIEAGFNQLQRGGVLVMVGAGIEAPAFDPNRMILNELNVTGSYVYDQGGFDRALELLASGRIPGDLLIDGTDVPLNGLGEALEALATGRIAGKVMVVPEVWL